MLRGIFLLQERELRWLYQWGTSELFPDAWEKYLEPVASDARADLIRAYHALLTSDDASERMRAAKAWSIWEAATSYLRVNADYVARAGDDEFALAFARIECHYFVNKGFFEADTQLIDRVGKIRHIPAVIVQGRYDVVCPMVTAWELHKAWPEADFRIVADAGHSAYEAGTVHELVSATDAFASDAPRP